MRYRTFGRTGELISALGFGCMRLPVLGERQDRIDEPLATAMLRHAIDHGVNYVDTAYPYHSVTMGSPGESEPFVGRALSDGYRERVLLATKLPVWSVQSAGDMDRILDHQLERLATDRIDCYLLHGLNAGSWDKVAKLGALEFLDRARADGRIRHAGFSFHDDGAVFAPIVDSHDWDFCQIQYNYMDLDYQAGQAGLDYAVERGLAVVVMEPLKGGRLANRIPSGVREIWERAEPPRDPIASALRFVWSQPGVSLLLSGMSNMEQVVENLEAADRFGLAAGLSDEEAALFGKARSVYRARTKADCTACRYCLPCSAGVDIPGIMAALNDVSQYEDPAASRWLYNTVAGKASLCEQCADCEEACPQDLPIRQLLEEARQLFED